ncbi:MAG: NRDE family protein [Bacteroidetes bacterium]|nr:NRDE family protein [Bacteroidota bacterium]
MLNQLRISASRLLPLYFGWNRDEFYNQRRKLQWEDEFPEILAGKDLQEGGTWMGINKTDNLRAHQLPRFKQYQHQCTPQEAIW